jgi:hypothetical protein
MRSIRPLSSSVAAPLVMKSTFLPSLCEVAHHAREAREHEVHRHHADRHHRFLQVAGVAGQLADAVEQALVQHRVQRVDALLDHRLRDHQLADQVDQLVDLFDRDADRGRFGAGGRGLSFSFSFLTTFFSSSGGVSITMPAAARICSTGWKKP